MSASLTVPANKPELQNVEKNMLILKPRFDALLGDGLLKSDTLIQSLLVSIERNNKLMNCDMSTLIAGAMTFATLRLPIDGASGQGFLLPFKKVAQPCIGYKGYNTIAGRSGITIQAGHVREGDLFEWEEGTDGFVKHKRVLDSKRPIIAFWATATANDRPPVVKVLGRGEVNDVMERSPAVKSGADTPWKDPVIGFPAMGEKTARRRLARSIPWEVDNGRFLLAARMEEAFEEQGRRSWIDNGTVMLEGQGGGAATPFREQAPQPSATTLMAPRGSDHERDLKAAGDREAAKGTNALKVWFLSLDPRDKRLIEAYKDSDLKKKAEEKDKADIAAFDGKQ